MNLIIKIDDDIAKGIRGENECEVEPREIVRSFQATIADAIKNGTPVSTDGDLISREALKKDLASYDREFAPDWVLNCIDNAPTVEVRDNKPKQGEWIFDGWGTYCSECGDRPKIGCGKFCSECGADMQKGGAE